jgi:arylsulfatase A-like enzyme
MIFPAKLARSGRFLALLWLLLTVAGACSQPPEQAKSAQTPRQKHRDLSAKWDPTIQRPNVLMIAFDNVRADRMSSYGSPRRTTPNLDALAQQGTRFADCTAQAPYTPHSFSSLFSSLHVADLPVRERARGVREPILRAGLDSFHVTLPEALQEAGYFTGAVMRGWFTDAFGLTQGYDWIDYRKRGHPELPTVVRTSIRWLRQWQETKADQPFFLFAYTVDVHYPFMKGRSPEAHIFGGDPEGFTINRETMTAYNKNRAGVREADLQNALTLYDEGLYWADQEIQPLLDELDALGLTENTIILFVSDHGEEFGEHGYLSHGQSNFRTVVDVPLIVKAPGFPDQNVVTTPVMNIDIMPTVLDLCKVPIPEGVKGRSLVPSLRGETQPELEQRSILSEGAWNGFVGLARAGDYSYLLDKKDNRFLFDLSTDPDQITNLASQKPELAERLDRILFQHKWEGLATQLLLLQGGTLELDRHALPVLSSELFTQPMTDADSAPVLSEESIDQLKALGYLQ